MRNVRRKGIRGIGVSRIKRRWVWWKSRETADLDAVCGEDKGRKPSVNVERVRELRESGMGASAIAKELGIGRASVYRALQG